MSTQFARATSESARNERPIAIAGFADAAWAMVLRGAFFARCAAELACWRIFDRSRGYEKSLG